jgi:hypothetical protein
MPPAPSTGALPADLTAREAPTAKANPGDAIAKLTPRLSEPPAPGSLSYATLGSASLDTSEPAPPKSRKGLVAIVALIAAVAAGATVVSFTMFKGKPQPGPAAAAAHGPVDPSPSLVPSPSAAPAPATSASPAASDSPSANGGIPVISATSLPTVTPTPPPPRWSPPPVIVAPPPPPPATAAPVAPTPTSKPKKTVDDGF